MPVPRTPAGAVTASVLLILLLVPLCGSPAALGQAGAAAPQTASAPTSDQEIERFLREARVVRERSAGKGVTNSIRATLSDDKVTHDAHIQFVEERRSTGPGPKGVELNFRDSWTFNIAAYRLDRLIGLDLVPVSIERSYKGKTGAFTWWVDNVLMDEGERLKKKIEPPSPAIWNETMQLVRIFDQLIYNMDRNMGNLLITKDWRIWAIDHTRAFRLHKDLKSPANVTRCDRGVFEALKRLDSASLDRELGKYLNSWERDSLLARRDKIIAVLEKGGEGALYNRRQ